MKASFIKIPFLCYRVIFIPNFYWLNLCSNSRYVSIFDSVLKCLLVLVCTCTYATYFPGSQLLSILCYYLPVYTVLACYDVMNREGDTVPEVRQNQRMYQPFNWSIIKLYYFILTYKCKAGLKWNTGYLL